MAIVSTGQITILDINDGTSFNLTSDSKTIVVDANNNVSYTGAETYFKIIEAGQDSTSLWTFYIKATGGGISYRDDNDAADRTLTGETDGLLNGIPGYVKVVALTQTLSWLDIAAKRGSVEVVKRFSVATVRDGTNGSPGSPGAPGSTAQGLVVNGGVETGTNANWIVFENATIATGNSYSGFYSIRQAVVAGGPNCLTNAWPVAQYEVYKLSCFVKRDEASLPDANISLGYRIYNSAGNQIGSRVSLKTANKDVQGWQALTGEAVITSNTAFTMVLDVGEAGGTTGHWFIDDCSATLKGLRGSITTAKDISGKATNNAWVDSYADEAITDVGGIVPLQGDIVTLYNSALGFSQTRTRSSAGTWTALTAIFGGDLIVDKSITAAKVNTQGLTIQDANGNVIFDAQTKVNKNFLKGVWVYNATGSQTGYNQNGTSTTGSNKIDLLPTPDAGRGNVWVATSGTANGVSGEGGWDTTSFAIDHTKAYRFSVWIKRVGSNTSGSYYLGVGPAYFAPAAPAGWTGTPEQWYNQWYNEMILTDYTSQDVVTNLQINTTTNKPAKNNNPYFISSGRTDLPENVWCLLVGFVYPSNYTGTTNTDAGGLFNGETGAKIRNATDFKWAPNRTTCTHRSYQYYTTAAGAVQHFFDPRVEEINGSEPSIAELLSMGNISARNKLTSTNASTYIADAAIGNAQIGNFIRSTNFNGTITTAGQITDNGTTGWAIGKAGDAVFDAADIRGQLSASQIDTTNLTIKDGNGLTIFSAGQNLDFSRVGGATKPQDNANNTSVDASGNIQGVSGGAGTAVANNVLSSSTNLLYNADFSAGLDGWSASDTYKISQASGGVNLSTDWSVLPLGSPGNDTLWSRQAARIEEAGLNADEFYYEISSTNIPVIPGKRYIISAYTGAHRCKVAVFAYVFNNAGTATTNTYSSSTAENNAESSGGQRLSGYKRVYSYLTMPDTAAYIQIRLRKYNTKSGNTDSYMFVTRVQVEEAASNATFPGAWTSPGYVDQTSVRARNQITTSNVSTYVGAGAIGNIQIGALIQSTNFNGAFDSEGGLTAEGTAGWAINKSGEAVFNNITARGNITANSLSAANGTFAGDLVGSGGTFAGELQAATGTFSGSLSAGVLDISKLVGQTVTYSTPGTYTFNTNTLPAGYTSIRAILIGGGGGGANSGQTYDEGSASGPGGGGGGLSIATFNNVASGTVITITVGAGGAGGAARPQNGGRNTFGEAQSGSAGGATTISGTGISLTAGGGGGAVAPFNNGSNRAVGAGGTGTTANGFPGIFEVDNTYYAGTDKSGNPVYGGGLVRGGDGGNSGLNYGSGGTGGAAVFGTAPAGNPGNAPGGGGGGAAIARNNYAALGGGAGGAGRAIIEFFNPNGVIIRSEWNTLISALQRQGIAVT